MRTVNLIIIHCSATREGKPYTVADIDRWHRDRGMKGIGYHFVVYLDGTVHSGRPLEQVGAHCKGHNNLSVGVCYIGGLAADGKTPKDTRTIEQRQGLIRLLHQLHILFPKAIIRGHRDFAPKACPCFDAKAEYANL